MPAISATPDAQDAISAQYSALILDTLPTVAAFTSPQISGSTVVPVEKKLGSVPRMGDSDSPRTGTLAASTTLAKVLSRLSLRSKMTWTWSCCTSFWALASAVDGLFWSSRMSAWTGWPLIPPAALVADTQSWNTVLASAVDPDATPVKVPRAPTLNGVPVAAPEAPPDVPEAGPAGGLPALEEEDEQPATASAARASAVSAAPARPIGLRLVSGRVIFVSLLPGHRAGSGRLDFGSRSCGTSGQLSIKSLIFYLY